MNTWAKRFHLTMTIGGGFTGLAVGLATLFSGWSQYQILALILMLGFCALCLWSIYVGLRVADGRNVRNELRLFYILQIPYFTTPALSYHVGYGLMLYAGILPNGQNLQAKLGADWGAGVLAGDGWSLAVNFVPILALWMLRRAG